MNRDFKINLFLTAFLVGVAIVSKVLADSLFFYVGVLMLGILLVLIWKMGRSWWKLGMILLMMGGLAGGVRVMVDWRMDQSLLALKLYGQKVYLEGEVFNAPIKQETFQQFYLLVRKIDLQKTGEPVAVPDKLLVRVKLQMFPQLNLGDSVRLKGTMLTPENSDGFNYADFLMKDHVYWMLGSPGLSKVLKEASFEWWDLQDDLFWLRRVFLEETYALFVEPSGGIMAGTLIGDRANIADGILANFQTTGLTHILAISGFNISLIINLISLVVAKRGKWVRFLITLALIICFVIITGGGASVLRAAVMGALMLGVKTFGRSSQILKIILLSGFLMAMLNPRIVDFDISFQLSFFATMSLILYADQVAGFWEIREKESWQQSKIEQFLQALKVFMKEGIMTTIAAQVITLPIIFYSFGTVSLISPLANLVVGPFVPMIMLFGFMAVMVGFGWFFVGNLIAGVGSLLVILMLKIVELFAKIPLASVSLGKGQIWLALIYYLAVFRFFHICRPEPGSFRAFDLPP